MNGMEIDAAGKRDEAISFLMAHNTGILSTVSAEGQPRARTVYYVCDDKFNVYFITLASTRKVEDLSATPRVAFVVSESVLPRTLQMEGVVEDLSDQAGISPELSDLVTTLMSSTKYGAPLARFDTSILKFYRIKPTWIRWGNFLFGHHTQDVLSEVTLAEEN